MKPEEDFDFGSTLDKVIEGKKEEYLHSVEKYLDPPFTFDLPESEKKLIIGDPGYDYFMCRKNVGGNVAEAINVAISDPDIGFDAKQSGRLTEIRDDVLALMSANGNRTRKDMEELRRLIEESVSIMKGGNEGFEKAA